MLKKLLLGTIAYVLLSGAPVQAASSSEPEYFVSYCVWVVPGKFCNPTGFSMQYDVGQKGNAYGTALGGSLLVLGTAKGDQASLVVPSPMADQPVHVVYQIDTKRLTFNSFNADGTPHISGAICHRKGTEAMRCWNPSMN